MGGTVHGRAGGGGGRAGPSSRRWWSGQPWRRRRARGVGLRIVHAWHFSPAYDDLVFAGGDRTELETELRSSFSAALHDLLSTYPDVAFELVVQHGRPGDVLAREAG